MIFFSIFDRKASSFSPAVAYPDRATAERSFCALLADRSTTVGQWPDDFALYELGNFDPATGAIEPISVPVCVLTGQSGIYILDEMRARASKGGAVGETSKEVAPEDKDQPKADPDGSSPVSESVSYKATPDLV